MYPPSQSKYETVPSCQKITLWLRQPSHSSHVCVYMLSHFSCVWLCYHLDYSPLGSSVHGILQARIQEWVAMPYSRGSSWPRDGTWISRVSCIAGGLFTLWAIREPESLQPLICFISLRFCLFKNIIRMESQCVALCFWILLLSIRQLIILCVVMCISSSFITEE